MKHGNRTHVLYCQLYINHPIAAINSLREVQSDKYFIK